MKKIKKITKEKYDGYVYNITVADNHNYYVEDCLVSNCHEQSNKQGKHGDLDLMADVWDTALPGTEIALGGGSTLSHPNIETFLKRVTAKGCIPNITVNTLHIKKQSEQIRQYQEEKLVYGIGISYRGKEYLKNLPKNIKYDHAVFHMILGLNDDTDCQAVIDWCKDNHIHPKILFLGYKQYGNGSGYYEQNPWLQDKLDLWKNGLLKKVMQNTGTFSFDNLAIKQLDLQKTLPKWTWDRFYQGNDGTHTFYIDAVNEEVARTSTTKERFKIEKGNSLKELFGKVKLS